MCAHVCAYILTHLNPQGRITPLKVLPGLLKPSIKVSCRWVSKGGGGGEGRGGEDAQVFSHFQFHPTPHSGVDTRQPSLGRVVPPWLTAALSWGGEDACRRLAVTLLALA